MECEGDDVVEHEVWVLQRDPAAAPGQDDEVQYSTVQYSTVPGQDDEVLHAGQLQLGAGGGGEPHAERQGARLPAASHQEVLNINNH